ncbi:DUF4129 domain-containing protein [Georgenia sp. SYP-B2076]|uniref:DUF4129 domain-containing protein n=1 Tax=Georgenia sp. SYP-B2076 TaxID=2495881 RepID=UPI00197A90E0|nr:DUF4129 domain-containing protein [Georgenia sp. SYP-B2076]
MLVPTLWLTLARGVPVDPDAAEARRWAERELSKAVYDTSPSLLDRIADWLGSLLDGLGRLGGATPSALVPVILVVLFVGVVALALALGGRARRRRAADLVAGSSALFEDYRTSAELAATADAAARRGDFALAVLERFRSIIRGLDERAILDDRPGLTAHEATTLAAERLPDVTAGLIWAGDLFDGVRYGRTTPGQPDDEALRRLATEVAHARPARPVGGPGGHDAARLVGAQPGAEARGGADGRDS